MSCRKSKLKEDMVKLREEMSKLEKADIVREEWDFHAIPQVSSQLTLIENSPRQPTHTHRHGTASSPLGCTNACHAN
jgi:hypothetical protein